MSLGFGFFLGRRIDNRCNPLSLLVGLAPKMLQRRSHHFQFVIFQDVGFLGLPASGV